MRLARLAAVAAGACGLLVALAAPRAGAPPAAAHATGSSGSSLADVIVQPGVIQAARDHVAVLAASGGSGAADVGLDESTYYLFPVTSWLASPPVKVFFYPERAMVLPPGPAVTCWIRVSSWVYTAG
jgi:hypothetical protein